jgi:hypothetical protein
VGGSAVAIGVGDSGTGTDTGVSVAVAVGDWGRPVAAGAGSEALHAKNDASNTVAASVRRQENGEIMFRMRNRGGLTPLAGQYMGWRVEWASPHLNAYTYRGSSYNHELACNPVPG